MALNSIARRFIVHGRVQGVGFRYFVERAALDLQLTGYVTNRADGTVEVYAGGDQEKLDRLRELLSYGPRWARVERIDESEAAPDQGCEFRITH